jgi:hypothetical protein
LAVIFAGLDGEMTGSDVNRHSLIQIGLALSESLVFESRIAWEDFEYDPAALNAIRVTPESICTGPSAEEVDSHLVRWLQSHGVAERSIVPIGWAVSDFDRPFVQKFLPRFYEYLHHHSVELNAVVYSLAGARKYLGETVEFSRWKEMAKKISMLAILNRRGLPAKEHDAGDDALMGLISWNWLRAIIAE